MVNLDGDHWNYYLNDLAKKEDLSSDDLKEIIHWYTDTDITDLLFNILDQSSNTKTNVMSFRGDMYTDGVEGSAPIDYSFFEWNYVIMKQKNIDVFDIWFDECKANNINPWISLRMNDRHESGEETSIFRGDLFYRAKSNGWMLGEEYNQYSTCFNYEIKEIRDTFLDYIEEQLLQYDVYGIELDFIREIYCFDYLNKEASYLCGIMNDFIRKAHSIRAVAENKWGHDIKISVRLPRDLEQAYEYGFDALTWNEEQLIDSITVTGREHCDSAMPIAYWKEKLPNIAINAGLESKFSMNAPRSPSGVEMVNGYAAQYLTSGADGIYLFNYSKISEANTRLDEIYNSFKSIGDILHSNRRHVVAAQDLTPKGYEPYKPLPLKINFLKEAKLNVETGLIPEGKKMSLIVGLDHHITYDFSVSINDVALTPKGTTTVYDGIGNSVELDDAASDIIFYLFEAENIECATNIQSVLLKSHHPFIVAVEYLEIVINN